MISSFLHHPLIILSSSSSWSSSSKSNTKRDGVALRRSHLSMQVTQESASVSVIFFIIAEVIVVVFTVQNPIHTGSRARFWGSSWLWRRLHSFPPTRANHRCHHYNSHDSPTTIIIGFYLFSWTVKGLVLWGTHHLEFFLHLCYNSIISSDGSSLRDDAPLLVLSAEPCKMSNIYANIYSFEHLCF